MTSGPAPSALSDQKRHASAEPATDRETLLAKESAHWQALYLAWFATGLEQTKSIFALAAAGVGLCATLISADHTKGLASWTPIWLFLSLIAFALSACAALGVLHINGKLIAKLVREQDETPEDGLVRRLHGACWACFVAGIACLVSAEFTQIWF
jgi:hypothetical protein